MAGILHKYNKKAKQRDFRTHVDRNLIKNPRYLSVSAIATQQQSPSETKNVSPEEKELLEQKK